MTILLIQVYSVAFQLNLLMYKGLLCGLTLHAPLNRLFSLHKYISPAPPAGHEIQIAITYDASCVAEGCNAQLASNRFLYLFISHISECGRKLFTVIGLFHFAALHPAATIYVIVSLLPGTRAQCQSAGSEQEVKITPGQQQSGFVLHGSTHGANWRNFTVKDPRCVLCILKYLQLLSQQSRCVAL